MKPLQARLRILEGFLQDLCLNIGERPAGSANNRLAQEYIGRQFQRQGFQVEYREFESIEHRRLNKSAGVIARSRAASTLDKTLGKKIALSAHLDTKPGTPGALDNTSGVAALLLLGELLQYQLDQIALEFICFNREDHHSNAGEPALLEMYKNHFHEILFNVNLDRVGYKKGRMGVSYHACPDSLVSISERLLSEYEKIEVMEPWQQGDHMLFVTNNVPAIAVTSVENLTLIDSVLHPEKDALELLDSASILAVVDFTYRLITRASKILM